MLSRWGSEQPEGLQWEGAPSDLVRSSDAPHSRPWPSAQTCCLCSHLPVLTCAHQPVLPRRFPTLAVRLPRPQRPVALLSGSAAHPVGQLCRRQQDVSLMGCSLPW